MKVDEAQKSTASHNEIQMKREPFFKKDGQGGFFSKSTESKTSFFNPSTIQPKLTIGQPNDKYEVEADEMADKVVQRLSDTSSNNTNYIQPKCHECEQKEKLQKKEEDEISENEIGLQRKPIFESNANEPEDNLQRKPLPNIKLQRKCASCEEKEKLNKKEDEFSETEEDIQQKSETTQNQAGYDVESHLNSSKGKGRPLSGNVEKSMGSAFGADFSNVRVHTGSQAVQMNKALGAQAFTHGNNIYFNQGKYDTNSSSGKHLLAHELTHTIQQGSSTVVPKLQKQGNDELIEGPPMPDNTPVEQTGEECPDLIPDYPLEPEVTPSGDSKADASFYESLLGFAGVGVGGGVLGMVSGLVGDIAYWTWRQLPDSVKIRAINTALNSAESAFASGRAMGREVLGASFGFMSAAMLGFIRKVKSLDNEEKIRIFEKSGKILLGQSLDFSLGMLKGIVVGFVMDGLVGIIQLIIDLFCFIPKILDFFRSLKNFFEQLPEEMMALYQSLAEVRTDAENVLANAMDEFLEMIKDPRRVVGLLNTIYEAGASAAEKAGEAMANAMIRAIRLPAFSLGEIVGRIGGQVIFEVVLALLTGGGGAVVTTAKVGLKLVAKFFMKAGRFIFTIVRYLGSVLRKIGTAIRGAGRFLSARLKSLALSIRGVIDNILALFGKFNKYCRPGSIRCLLPIKNIASVLGKTGRRVFGELRFRGLVQNRALRSLTHQDIYKAFRNLPFTPSNHAIMRLKDIRTYNLGVRSLNDFARIINNGVISDAGRGLISISHGSFEAIVNPRTFIIVTFKPI